MVMTDSKQLAGLIGPTMVALGTTEAINIEVFSNQIAPVVYLNGAILFVAGLAIVRAHNLWTWRWPVIMTLTGWVALFGGHCRDRHHSDCQGLRSAGVLGTRTL